MYFKDRAEAGKHLADLLKNFSGKNIVVYALPRGGVIVAAEIAKQLHAPLDLLITRKIGHPNQPEYAIGAVAEDGHLILNQNEASKIDAQYLQQEIKRQTKEAKRRRKIYLGLKKPLPCKGKIAVIVDDGIATGLTVKAAIQELRFHFFPKKIIVATPVVSKEIINELINDQVEVVFITLMKAHQTSIGEYYENFSPIEDHEVIKILNL